MATTSWVSTQCFTPSTSCVRSGGELDPYKGELDPYNIDEAIEHIHVTVWRREGSWLVGELDSSH
jgi:hypothetical protein